jgi:hypothetical protein
MRLSKKDKETDCDCNKVKRRPKKKTTNIKRSRSIPNVHTTADIIPQHPITTIQMYSPSLPPPYINPQPPAPRSQRLPPSRTIETQTDLSEDRYNPPVNYMVEQNIGRSLTDYAIYPSARNLQSLTPSARTIETQTQPSARTIETQTDLTDGSFLKQLKQEPIQQSVVIVSNSGTTIAQPIAQDYPIARSDVSNEPIARSDVSNEPMFDSMAYEEPFRSFEEIRSRNELVRESIDTQTDIDNNIRDEYNLTLNTPTGNRPGLISEESKIEEFYSPSVFDNIEISFTQPDEIPMREEPVEVDDETVEYRGGGGERRGRGRPYSQLSDTDITLLEQYYRVKDSTKRKNRSLMEQAIVSQGDRLISNKRANPYLQPIIDGIKAQIESEKK